MATLSDRATYSGLYSGLANNAVFAVVIAGVGLVVFESLRRVRAHSNRYDVKMSKLGGPLGSVETWEFGYFYMARSWSLHPPPALGPAPLSWIWPTIRFPERELPKLTRSLDAVVHVRYLTACLWFALIHVCTSLPIVLPIHLIFNTPGLDAASMNNASLQYISTSDRFLWVHWVILCWLAATWIGALIWLTRGALRYRYASILRAYHEVSQQPLSEQSKHLRGRRFRTVMVENIPGSMRNESVLREYFERYLSLSSLRGAYLQRGWLGWWGVVRNQFVRDLDSMPINEESPEEREGATVDDVILVRQAHELQALVEQRETILRKLEALHVKLACNVLDAVAAARSLRQYVASRKLTEKSAQNSTTENAKRTDLRLDKLIEAIGPFLDAFEKEDSEMPPLPIQGETIWEALYRLPPELLHPYQPLIRMKPRYSGRMDVAIDYYALKLATISKQIDDERAVEDANRPPSGTAFVTFAAPHSARKAFRFLAFNPRSPDTCFVTPAPDPSDIIWKRAMTPSFRGVFVRDLLVSIGVWTFTLLWVPPVTIIVGLFSIRNLAAIFPPLRDYFNANPAKESLVSSFLPTLLYSILVVLIPPLLLFITNHGHSAITASKINDLVMCRYWKFLVCNAVFFFSLGVTTISSFVNVFKQPLSLLLEIAQTFPNAAPFFVGWFVFETGMHVGLSISLMGFPIWMYPFHRAATTLRRRQEVTKPRTYDFSYWLPTHMLVNLIMHVFTILNPLVIPFYFIYLCFEIIIVKHQKMHVFSRAFETNGYNINHRILRYSCDGLVFSQFIFLVLMILVKKAGEAVLTGLLIVVTILAKLYLSRKCKAAYATLDKLEGDLMCSVQAIGGPTDKGPPQTNSPRNHGSIAKRLTERWLELWKTFPFDMKFAGIQLRPTTADPPVRNGDTPAAEDTDPAAVSAPRTADITMTQGQYMPPVTHPVLGPQSDPNQEHNAELNDSQPVVTPHPPTSLWDDSPRYEASYGNPLYECPLDNFMWLPRNPLARLDMDDGVNVYAALLSRPASGWRGVGRMPKDLEAQVFGGISETANSDENIPLERDVRPEEARKSIAHEPLLQPKMPIKKGPGRTLEEIELPPIIAARIQHPESELEIEEVESGVLQGHLRPALSRARSSASRASKRMSLHHGSFHEAQSPSPEGDALPAILSAPQEETPGMPSSPSLRSAQSTQGGGTEYLTNLDSTGTNAASSPTLSSFRALATVVMREARQEREERERKERKENESRLGRSSLSQVLDTHGRVQGS